MNEGEITQSFFACVPLKCFQLKMAVLSKPASFRRNRSLFASKQSFSAIFCRFAQTQLYGPLFAKPKITYLVLMPGTSLKFSLCKTYFSWPRLYHSGRAHSSNEIRWLCVRILPGAGLFSSIFSYFPPLVESLFRFLKEVHLLMCIVK